MIVRTVTILALALGLVAPAAAQARLEAGVLECTVAGGAGFIFGSTKELGCTFRPAGGAPAEYYTGTISSFGIDVGATSQSELVWGVLAPTTVLGEDALAGRYVGVSAEATAGVGIGANALVGGFDRSIVLNPVSLQTQTGIDIAAGIAELRLQEAELVTPTANE